MANYSSLLKILLFAATIITTVLGALYELEDEVVGWDFYTHFDFENVADPTHGRVEYVNRWTAITQNLTFACRDAFILRADDKTILDPEGPGRRSVRLRSFRKFENVVLVFDIRHMPQGCGTWPAVWTRAPNWPYGGEIDIVEGVNDQPPNAVTLHTNEGCTMPANRTQIGTAAQNDCNAFVNYNTGCGVKLKNPNSYGPLFNDNGGGWYAMERSPSHIRAWFWPRNGDVPWDVQFGGGQVHPDSWGAPDAYFPNTPTCDIDEHFAPQWITINLTFCGDWAGNAYGSSSCPGTCVDYVNNNPQAFSEAFFDFASLRIYQPSDNDGDISFNITVDLM